MAQFNFELVSPEEKLISEPAFQVTIPGLEGDVGIRAGHMSLVVVVRPGIVAVQREENGAVEQIFVAGGFADIGQNHATILAEEAVPVDELNRERLEQELRDLNDDVKVAESEGESAKLETRKALVSAMLVSIGA